MIHVGMHLLRVAVCAPMCWNISLSRVECSSLQFADSQSPDNTTSFFFVSVRTPIHFVSLYPPFLSLFRRFIWGTQTRLFNFTPGQTIYTIAPYSSCLYRICPCPGGDLWFYHGHIGDSNPLKEGYHVASFGSAINLHQRTSTPFLASYGAICCLKHN